MRTFRGLLLFCSFVMLAAIAIPNTSHAGAKHFVDSSDYKDKDFKKGIIADYSDMIEGDDVDWVSINPGDTLSEYKLHVGKVDNKSEIRSKSLVDHVHSILNDSFADMDVKSNKTLTVDVCIYEAQNMSIGKAWIPFVGGHQMQAGIGLELVLHNQSGTPIAKFRHFARKGGQLESAAQEAVSDLTRYIAKH